MYFSEQPCELHFRDEGPEVGRDGELAASHTDSKDQLCDLIPDHSVTNSKLSLMTLLLIRAAAPDNSFQSFGLLFLSFTPTLQMFSSIKSEDD